MDGGLTQLATFNYKLKVTAEELVKMEVLYQTLHFKLRILTYFTFTAKFSFIH